MSNVLLSEATSEQLLAALNKVFKSYVFSGDKEGSGSSEAFSVFQWKGSMVEKSGHGRIVNGYVDYFHKMCFKEHYDDNPEKYFNDDHDI